MRTHTAARARAGKPAAGGAGHRADLGDVPLLGGAGADGCALTVAARGYGEHPAHERAVPGRGESRRSASASDNQTPRTVLYALNRSGQLTPAESALSRRTICGRGSAPTATAMPTLPTSMRWLPSRSSSIARMFSSQCVAHRASRSSRRGGRTQPACGIRARTGASTPAIIQLSPRHSKLRAIAPCRSARFSSELLRCANATAFSRAGRLGWLVLTVSLPHMHAARASHQVASHRLGARVSLRMTTCPGAGAMRLIIRLHRRTKILRLAVLRSPHSGPVSCTLTCSALSTRPRSQRSACIHHVVYTPHISLALCLCQSDERSLWWPMLGSVGVST